MTASYRSEAALLAATLVGAAAQPTRNKGRSLVSRGIFAAICALGALTLPAAASAQELALEGQDLIDGVPRRQIQATRLAEGERIVLDGRLDEGIWQRAQPAKDFIQIDPQNGTAGHRAHGGPHRLQRGRLLHGRHRLRLRAGQVARLPAPPRRVPLVRRSFHVAHRYLPRRTVRLFLRDEPLGPDGRRRLRRQRDEPRVGRHLERARAPQRDRLDASRSRSPSARSTSTPTTTPGASTSSARCGARTKTASGWDGPATRVSTG